MAATMEQKKRIGKILIHEYQAAAGALDNWWKETWRLRDSERLANKLTATGPDELLGEWEPMLAQAQAAVSALPPKDLLAWEPDVKILDKREV